MDLDIQFEMIIFQSIFTTFKASHIFRDSWGSMYYLHCEPTIVTFNGPDIHACNMNISISFFAYYKSFFLEITSIPNRFDLIPK